jgi:hypothetical protein
VVLGCSVYRRDLRAFDDSSPELTEDEMFVAQQLIGEVSKTLMAPTLALLTKTTV